jgi:hypothetical protein
MLFSVLMASEVRVTLTPAASLALPRGLITVTLPPFPPPPEHPVVQSTVISPAEFTAAEWMEIGKIHLDTLVTIIRNTGITPDAFHRRVLQFGDSHTASDDWVNSMRSLLQTKYGDGGVDISPIADCYKTEVWQMGRELGVLEDIINAAPTDGLWDDGRTDEDQLGLTYADLEVAMRMDLGEIESTVPELVANLEKFRAIQARSLHKMNPIPVFKKSLA